MAYYKNNDKIINPKLMLRFECKAINHLQVMRLPVSVDETAPVLTEQQPPPLTPMGLLSETSKNKDDKKILFLIAACSDNYIRFFNL